PTGGGDGGGRPGRVHRLVPVAGVAAGIPRPGDRGHRPVADLPGGGPGGPARGGRQGGRADEPRGAVLLYLAAAVRLVRPQDAVLLAADGEPRRRPLVLRPPLQRVPTIEPLPGCAAYSLAYHRQYEHPASYEAQAKCKDEE